jgi:hypothetical protein
MAALRDDSMLEVEILGEYNAETERATPRFEAMVKLPGQSLSSRTLVKLAKHPTPDNTKIAPVDDVPSSLFSLSFEPPGTPRNVPEADSENTGTPYGTRAERLEGMLAEILAGTVETAVFAPESPLNQEEKMELAKLIIELDLGIEKTIWLLWGVRRGGRNHNLYTEARAMLERLWRGDGNEK